MAARGGFRTADIAKVIESHTEVIEEGLTGLKKLGADLSSVILSERPVLNGTEKQ